MADHPTTKKNLRCTIGIHQWVYYTTEESRKTGKVIAKCRRCEYKKSVSTRDMTA